MVHLRLLRLSPDPRGPLLWVLGGRRRMRMPRGLPRSLTTAARWPSVGLKTWRLASVPWACDLDLRSLRHRDHRSLRRRPRRLARPTPLQPATPLTAPSLRPPPPPLVRRGASVAAAPILAISARTLRGPQMPLCMQRLSGLLHPSAPIVAPTGRPSLPGIC